MHHATLMLHGLQVKYLDILFLDTLQGEFGARSGVGAVFAGATHDALADRGHVAVHACLHVGQRFVDPSSIASMWDEFRYEFELVVKAVHVHPCIGIDEVARVIHSEAVRSEQPLVCFHLTFVTYLPVTIYVHLFVFARRLVIDDDEFACLIDPDIIDGAKDMEISWLMQRVDAREIVPPLIHLLVFERLHREFMLNHDGVLRASRSVHIEFFLEELIDGLVDVERRRVRPGDLEPDIEPKAAWALHEKFYLGAADFKGCFLARFVR